MSIVNQMLQDLEQRRTATAGPSPLGGLSASDTISKSTVSMNYLLLGAVLVLAVVTAFLFGSQRSVPLSVLSTPGVTSSIVQTIKEAPVAKENPTEVVIASSMDSMQSVKTESLADLSAGGNVIANIEKSHVRPEKPVQQKNSQAVVNSKPEILNRQALSKKVLDKKTPVRVATIESSVENTDKQTLYIEGESESLVKAAEQTEKNEAVTPVVISKRVRPLTRPQQAQQNFQKAVSQLGRGQQVQAHDSLVKALSFDSSHLRARETLAALLLNTGRVSEAGSMLQDGLRINPAATTLAKLYARILVDQGNTAESISVLERALPSVASDPDYHALLAAFYQRSGKNGQAAQAYQKVLRVRPGVASWWMGLGLSLESVGEQAQARTAYQRAQRVGGLSIEVQKFVTGRVNALITLKEH